MRRGRFKVVAWCVVCCGCFGGGGSDGGGAEVRGSNVPSSWGEYCAEIGEVYCQREEGCEPGSRETCEQGFALGCCAEDNACASSFGADVSNEAYEQCIDDTNVAACGAQAPASCVELAMGGPTMQPGRPKTLEEACSASCEAQAATNCPGVETALRCTSLCIDIADALPECAQPWIELNACMAGAPLFCDAINGGAAVSSDDCGPEIDAFAAC